MTEKQNQQSEGVRPKDREKYLRAARAEIRLICKSAGYEWLVRAHAEAMADSYIGRMVARRIRSTP